MDAESAVEALRATPRRLDALLAGLGDEFARRAPLPDEWSAVEIVEHLLASDAIMAPRIPQVLARDGAPLASVDDRALALVLARARIPLADRLAHFRLGRIQLVNLLESLSPVEWEQAGHHEERGMVTVREIAGRIAEHELEHLHQLEGVIARVAPPFLELDLWRKGIEP